MPNLCIFDDLDIPLALGLLRLATAGRPDDFEAIALIHFALNHGVRIFDTADVYYLHGTDPRYGEHLMRDALADWNGPQEDVRVLTKVGLMQDGRVWKPNGDPRHIAESVELSLRALDTERIFLLQLHIRDPSVPFEKTLQALAKLQAAGKVQHLGLCNATDEELGQAQEHFPVACLQNELNATACRGPDDKMVRLTRERGISFLAYRPLGGTQKARSLSQNPTLSRIAADHETTSPNIAIAAVRAWGSHVIPLVGATRMQSVRASIEAVRLQLAAPEVRSIWGDSIASGSPAVEINHTQVIVADIPRLRVAEVAPSLDPEVVILMGIQGAGKSRLVERFTQAGYVRLNRDLAGGSLKGLTPQLDRRLAGGQSRVVLDNTYATREMRAPVIQAARKYRVPVRCLHLKTPLNEAQINVVMRMVQKYGMPLGPVEMEMFGKVDSNLPPPQALQRWLNQYEPPSRAEGFALLAEVPFEREWDPSQTNKGLLLDVDGTLRTSKSGDVFPRHPDDVLLLPHRRETLLKWVDDGYQLFFVSNQGGIAAGMTSHDAVQAALYRTQELLDLTITEITYCPHPTRPIGCFCRKPLPGLGVYLMLRHGLAHEHLVMVGDMQSDAQFAQALGIRFEHAETFFGETTGRVALSRT